ncbi:hypothetical protein B0H19DRAFT_1372370 [Mycena capillaripes]|nr:hypothetical protein B0H19DRAFT_1372370 [Mycena capillaripes]
MGDFMSASVAFVNTLFPIRKSHLDLDTDHVVRHVLCRQLDDVTDLLTPAYGSSVLISYSPDLTVSLLSSPKTDFPTSDALLSPIVFILILVIMQCRILIAFVVSCLTLSVAAAPIADSSILDRTPAPVEIERAPEPEPGCRIYSCV